MGLLPGRPTNASGRHILPSRRPSTANTTQRPSRPPRSSTPASRAVTSRTQVPQPHSASAAPDPSGTEAMAQNQAESMPAPQSMAMTRQVSMAYTNSAAALPYRDTAEANEDRKAAIIEVNSGPQSNISDAAKEPPRQLSEARSDWSRPEQAEIWSSGHWPSRKIEAALALVQLSALAHVQAQATPADIKPQPKRKREGDDEGEEAETKKIAKTEEVRPYKCPQCGDTFMRKEHLTRHQRCLHYGDLREMFECDICHKLFTRKDNVCEHRQRVHRETKRGPKPNSVVVDRDKKIIEDAVVGRDGTIQLVNNAPATLSAPVTANGLAQHGGGEEAETTDSSAQPSDDEAQDSEPPSSAAGNGGMSTMTTSGSSPPKTTTETGSRFNAVNK